MASSWTGVRVCENPPQWISFGLLQIPNFHKGVLGSWRAEWVVVVVCVCAIHTRRRRSKTGVQEAGEWWQRQSHRPRGLVLLKMLRLLLYSMTMSKL